MTHRDRIVLALGATFISTVTLATRGAPALSTWSARQETRAHLVHDELLRARSSVAQRAAMRDSVAAARARLAKLASELVSGGTGADAASALATVVSGIANDSRLKVATLQLQADTVPIAATISASVRLAGTTDITGLANFLRAIETSKTIMAIRELSVSQPDPAAPTTQPEALQVDVVVGTLARTRPELRR